MSEGRDLKKKKLELFMVWNILNSSRFGWIRDCPLSLCQGLLMEKQNKTKKQIMVEIEAALAKKKVDQKLNRQSIVIYGLLMTFFKYEKLDVK